MKFVVKSDTLVISAGSSMHYEDWQSLIEDVSSRFTSIEIQQQHIAGPNLALVASLVKQTPECKRLVFRDCTFQRDAHPLKDLLSWSSFAAIIKSSKLETLQLPKQMQDYAAANKLAFGEHCTVVYGDIPEKIPARKSFFASLLNHTKSHSQKPQSDNIAERPVTSSTFS